MAKLIHTLISHETLKELLRTFHDLTGVTHTIHCADQGALLRVPEEIATCTISSDNCPWDEQPYQDSITACATEAIKTGAAVRPCQCPCGIIFYVTPILHNTHHIANLVAGPVLDSEMTPAMHTCIAQAPALGNLSAAEIRQQIPSHTAESIQPLEELLLFFLHMLMRDSVHDLQMQTMNLELHSSEYRFTSIVDQLPQMVSYVDKNLTYLYINKSYETVFQATRETLLGKRLPDVIGAAAFEKTRQYIEKVLTGEAVKYEECYEDGHGNRQHIAGHLIPETDPIHGTVGYYAILTDITPYREAEDTARKGEAQLRDLGNNIPGGAIYRSHESQADGYTMEYISDGIEKILGYPPEAYYKTPRFFFDRIHPEDAPQYSTQREEAKQTGDPLEATIRVQHKDGSYRWIRLRASTTQIAGGGTAWNGVVLDVHEEQILREGLAANERFLSGIFDSIDDMLMVLHPDYTIARTNQRMDDLLAHLGPLQGALCYKVLEDRDTPCEKCPHRDNDDAISDTMTKQVVDCEGNTHILEIMTFLLHDNKGNLQAVIKHLRDITESIVIEKRRHHAEKMEAMGQLAGGISHDFNNLIGGIMGYAELIVRRSTEPRIKGYGEKIIKASQHATGLNRQLLTFSRRQPPSQSVIDLNRVTEESISLAQRGLNPNIEVSTTLSSESILTQGDLSEVQNAVLNLVINARDAMPEGGSLNLKTEQIDYSPAKYPGLAIEVPPGPYVTIAVKDSGSGIPAKALTHIFEPFYTTKAESKGTGMGLASVYGTMQRHDGSIQVESSPKHGTTFTLFFQRHVLNQKSSPTPDKPESEAPTLKSNARQNASVLVIEDDEMMSALMQEMLTEFGYSVTIQEDGILGRDYYLAHADEIDLVILDMMMPRLGGRAVFQAIREVQPDAKIIIVSGYSAANDTQACIDDGAAAFVAKPFDAKRMISAVNKALQ